MLKNKSVLEIEVGGQLFKMECNADCTLGQVHDALSLMKIYIIERMKEAEKGEDKKKEE